MVNFYKLSITTGISKETIELVFNEKVLQHFLKPIRGSLGWVFCFIKESGKRSFSHTCKGEIWG
jgi:hypothetical protein